MEEKITGLGGQVKPKRVHRTDTEEKSVGDIKREFLMKSTIAFFF